MGRRYYCEYCDKSFVETPDAVKKHRNGLLHQKLMKEHYNKFKGPQTILEEESCKNPCNRYLKNGECNFGSTCRYSHYTKEQLDHLRWEVEESQKFSSHQNFGGQSPSIETWFLSRRHRNLKDSLALSKMFTDTLPLQNMSLNNVTSWRYPETLDNVLGLPPSIRRLNMMDLENAKFTSWG